MNNSKLTDTHLAVKSELDGYRMHASRGQHTARAMVRLFESIDCELAELQELRRNYLALRGEIEDVQSQMYEAENQANEYANELQERRKAGVEPFCYLNRFTGRTFELEQQPGADRYPGVYIPLYTAPPVPVVPEEIPKGLAGQIVSLLAHNIGDKFLAQKIWNACRTAMPNGDIFRENSISSTNNFREIAETSTNSPVIPEGKFQ